MGNKFEPHSQDFVEILVIYDVQPEDGQLYSVKINGEMYPVAYLIIEDQPAESVETSAEGQSAAAGGMAPAVAGTNEPQFLTAPQTQ
jgi:hypothetical protein